MFCKKYLLLIIASTPFCLNAMLEDQELFSTLFSTYQGRQLTPETVVHEAPRLSVDNEQPMQSWLTEHPELIERLVVQSARHSSLRALAESQQENVHVLDAQGISHYGRSNYIIDGLGRFVMKIAGPFNRLESQIVAHRIPSYFTKHCTEEQIMALAPVDTYQTISYIPVFLRYLELQARHPLKHVTVPPTYLMHVPGRPGKLCDANYVVIQEKADILVHFEKGAMSDEAKARLSSLNQEQIYELVVLVFYCGLWNFNSNLLMTTDGRLSVVDLEQPNVTSPECFYLQEVPGSTPPPFIAFGKERYKRNVENGIHELYELFDSHSEQAQWIKTYATQIAAHYNSNFGTTITI